VPITVGLLLVLGFITVIVAIHELGHYLFARRFDMKIEQYFIGMGPKLWSTRRGETEYGVKAFPIGGYVRIAGMNPFETVRPEDLPRTYGAKPAWQRALVIFAGPASHFLVALAIFAALLAIYGKPIPAIEVLEIQRINDHVSPAGEAGILPGDVIVSADGQAIDIDNGERLGAIAEANVGEPVTYVVRRGDRELTFDVAPEPATVDGEQTARIGIVIGGATQPVGPVESVVRGGELVGRSVTQSFVTVGRVFGPEGVGSVFRALFTAEPRDPEGPTSVIGIGQVVGEAGTDGQWDQILELLGFATVFVGLINLVPLPPFDGGHLLLVGIEKLRRGRPVDMRKLVPVSVAVISLLVLFVGATMLLDITEPISLRP
jgi:membrane-associated protease RseP (regulator of RpoE activity)